MVTPAAQPYILRSTLVGAMGPSSLRDVLQSTIGDAYRLERELTGGGMSRVFLAEERALGRQVVVKLLPAESAELVSVERFRREIQLAARLQHPHIVPLLAAGQAGGIPYFTMPFVTGESLRARLARDGPLPVGDTVGVLRDVARALAYAHAQGVVHRDIKPDNVLLSGGLAMVTDFGVAKALGAATQRGGETLTGLGMALGTPAYMAPEQALGDAATDHRADIYALGCLGYELLAGTPPFSGRSPQAVVAAHVSEAPKPLASCAPDAPPALTALVMQCLAKEPADRPQSAGELVSALDTILAASSGGLARAGDAGRRPRRSLALAAAGVAVVVLAVAATQLARSGSLAARDTRTAAAVEPVRSIAVLPLETIGGGDEAAYLGEGITEEIANALTSVPGLRVAARTSARAARDRGLDVQQIGRALDVSRVLQGSVQRAGDRLRVGVRLVSAEDGTEIWTHRFDRDASDIFALQDEIAREVARRLRPSGVPPAGAPLVRAGTTDPEAHNLYLQGLHQLNRRDMVSLPKAVALFERAIARDPAYARAHAQLAVAYAVLPDYAAATTSAASEARALAAADRALALDSTVAEAHAVRGLVHGQRWNNGAAAAAHARGLAMEPNNPLVVFWNGIFRLRFPSRSDEAIAHMRRALELDPLSLVIGAAYGRALYQGGQPEAALAQYERVAQIDSTYAPLASHRAAALLALGRVDEAVAVQERELASRSSPVVHARLGHARAVAGDTAGARAALAEAVRRDSLQVAQVPIAILLAELGEQDEAVRHFIRGFERHDPSLDDYAQDPRLARLRRDPRLASYFSRMAAMPR